MSYSPLLFPLLAIGLFQLSRRARRYDGDLFLAVFGWATLLPLMVALLKIKDSEQHWTMMAMVPAIIAAGRLVDEHWEESKPLRTYFGVGIATTAALFVIVNVHAHTTAILRLLPADHYDAHADIVNEMVGWDQVRESLDQAVDATSGPVVLASTHYSLCGRLLFEMDDHPAVYCPTERRTEFDFMARRHPPAEATVIALTSEVHDQLPAELANRRCTRVDTVDVTRAGLNVARYYIHACPPASAGEVSARDAD
jgi:hypothetical protein